MKARNRFVFTVIAITIGLGAGIFLIVIYLINEDMVSSRPSGPQSKTWLLAKLPIVI